MLKEIENQLKLRWTLQLYKEYEFICYQYGIPLKKPIILLDDLSNAWGYWSSESKKIVISIHLIRNYSWQIVIGILKHEMAHQIVTELFRSNDSHQGYFLKACELIGVPYEFCKASLNFEKQNLDWRKEVNVDEDEALLRKLEKLLNLAQSANEHEAHLAMERVHELYTKYNISQLNHGLNTQHFFIVINLKKKQIPTLHSLISSILQDHYFINIVFSDCYDPFEDQTYKTIEILGTKSNILMAEYVFFFLKQRIEYLWNNYKKDKKLSARYKLSYQKGLLGGFQSHLDEIRNKKIHDQFFESNRVHVKCDLNELIKLKDIKLKEFKKRRFPKLVSKCNSGSTVYKEHFDLGKKEGAKIVLNKGIHENKKQNLFLN